MVPLLGRVRLIEHVPERVAKADLGLVVEDGDGSRRTLTGSRTRNFLPCCVTLSVTDRLSVAERFRSRYPSRSSSPMMKEAVPRVVPT